MSRKNISFLFFFKETLLIIGQGSQNVCLRKTVRRSENYFYTPGYRFVSVQMEKNNQQKQVYLEIAIGTAIPEIQAMGDYKLMLS